MKYNVKKALVITAACVVAFLFAITVSRCEEAPPPPKQQGITVFGGQYGSASHGVSAKDFFAYPSISYNGKLGGALGAAYQHPGSRVVVSLQAGYGYDKSYSGTAPFTVGCNTFAVPWSTTGEGQLSVVFGTMIPLGK